MICLTFDVFLLLLFVFQSQRACSVFFHGHITSITVGNFCFEFQDETFGFSPFLNVLFYNLFPPLKVDLVHNIEVASLSVEQRHPSLRDSWPPMFERVHNLVYNQACNLGSKECPHFEPFLHAFPCVVCCKFTNNLRTNTDGQFNHITNTANQLLLRQ